MKLRKTRRGFTIVELVIVVAVIGVLAAVLIPTFVNLTQKANKASDDSLVANLNKALVGREGEADDTKNETMHDAVEDLELWGYKLDNLVTKSGEKLLYDLKANRFLLESKADELKTENYWQVVNSLPSTQKYNYYAGNHFSAQEVTISVGFDVGDNERIRTIEYLNPTDTEKSVILRTNGGLLKIGTSETSTAKGQVWHFGMASSTVVYTETSCFHTHGLISSMDLKAGKAIAEDKGYVALVKAAPGTEVEEKDSGVFYIPSTTTTEDVDADVVSALGYNVTPTGTTATPEREAKEFYDVSNASELKAYRDGWNNGTITVNKVKLMANVDISEENWYPIGTWEYPFNGTFDGNNKTINGLYANSTDANHQGIYSNGDTVGFGETFGFFGIVGGGATTIKDTTFSSVYINIYNGKDVGAVVGYVPSLSKFKAANLNGADHFMPVDKWDDESQVGVHQITLSGLTVSGTINGTSAVGGITGKIYTSGKVEVLYCTNNANVTGTSNTSGIAGYIHYSSDITVDHCTNTGNVKLTGGAGIVHLNDLNNKKITNNTNTGNIIYNGSYNKSSSKSYSWDFIATGAHAENGRNYSEYHGNTNTGKFYIQDNEEAETTRGVLVVDAGETVTISAESEYNDVVVNGTLNINAETSIFGCVWVEASGTVNINAPLTVSGTQGTVHFKNSSLTIGTNGSLVAYYVTVPQNFTLSNNGTFRVSASTNNPNAASNGLKKDNLTVINNGTFIADSNMFYGNNLHFTNNGTYQGNMLLTGDATVINTENGKYEAHGGNGIDFRGGSGSFTNYASKPFGAGFDGVSIWVAGTYTVIGATPHLGATVTNLELSNDGNVWTATNK